MQKTDNSKNLFHKITQRLQITKSKALSCLLASFAFSFFIFIYSTINVYLSNANELPFSFKDFLPIYLIGFLAAFVFVFLVLIFTNKFLHRLAFSLTAGAAICTYVQSFVTTITFGGLPGDGMASSPSKQKIIINLAVWLIALAGFAIFAFMRKKAAFIRTVLCVALVAITVMQLFTLIPSAITYISSDKTNSKETYILSTENQLELSPEENIVVLVLDSFDRELLLEYLDSDPNATEGLEGFTCYDDNIAFYPRTYPATATMLSGNVNDFSLNRKDFFSEAYGNSPLLKDLQNNNYKINLYMPIYYGYDNADVLADYAANIALAKGYNVTSTKGLVKKMFYLSSYFWLPEIEKSQKISTGSFHEIGTYISDKTMYTIEPASDSDFYNRLTTEGLSATSPNKVFTFLHLRGCHPPFSMNENCEVVASGNATSLQQTTGSFKIIKEYLNQMKALGIYENSTIIITGDHAGSYAWTNNLTEYEKPMNTALLVKPKGASDEPFKISKAQVSQENFLAEIVKSADINTDYNYGTAYSDIDENETVLRNHYFITYTGSARKDELVTYEIAGDGTDISNWTIIDRKYIGSIYD